MNNNLGRYLKWDHVDAGFIINYDAIIGKWFSH
jgi:hypothetical protein